jgi:hypothetical protein
VRNVVSVGREVLGLVCEALDEVGGVGSDGREEGRSPGLFRECGGVGGGRVVLDIGREQMGNGGLDAGTKESALGLSVRDAMREFVERAGIGSGG